MVMTKSSEEWNLIGKAICSNRDWRWVVFWAYNIHKKFRSKFPNDVIWSELDSLVADEIRWHEGKELFERIRGVQLESKLSRSEELYFQLGEIVSKSISNASWYPGLFDYHVAWRIPSISIEISELIKDDELRDYLVHHFQSLSSNLTNDKPYKD
jgi:hypothetical protein